jgi:hypothetical protein
MVLHIFTRTIEVSSTMYRWSMNQTPGTHHMMHLLEVRTNLGHETKNVIPQPITDRKETAL